MVLAAHEDKTYRGALHRLADHAVGVGRPASSNPSGRLPPRVVARPLPDRHRADRRRRPRRRRAARSTTCSTASRSPTARSRRTRTSTARRTGPNLQLDEVADPIVLAWQLGRTDAAHVPRPRQDGGRLHRRLPGRARHAAGALGEPERLLARDDRGRDRRAGLRRRHRAAQRRRRVGRRATSAPPTTGSSASTAGPPRRTARTAPQPYYLRLTKDGNPNAGTTYNIGDSGPTASTSARSSTRASSSSSASASSRPTTRSIRNTVAGRRPASSAGRTPNGAVLAPLQLRRLRRDARTAARGTSASREPDRGLGQQHDDRPQLADLRRRARRVRAARRQRPRGARAPGARWPRRPTTATCCPSRCGTDFPPAGSPGFPLGEGTLSATPLAWSHAQFVRLAWSLDAGRPVEQPEIVACRYAHTGQGAVHALARRAAIVLGGGAAARPRGARRHARGLDHRPPAGPPRGRVRATAPTSTASRTAGSTPTAGTSPARWAACGRRR